jgi:hypothetical protein
MMNWKGSGRNLFKLLYRHLPGGTGIVSVLVGIGTEHLPNTNLDRYR